MHEYTETRVCTKQRTRLCLQMGLLVCMSYYKLLTCDKLSYDAAQLPHRV